MHDVPMRDFDVTADAAELLTPFYAIRDPKIDNDPMEPTKKCVDYQIGPQYFDVLAAYALQMGDEDNTNPKPVPIVNEMMVEILMRANKRLHFTDDATMEAKLQVAAESLVNKGVFGKVMSGTVVAKLLTMDPDTVDFYWLVMAACAFSMWHPRNEIIHKCQANAYLSYHYKFMNLPNSGPDYNLYLCNDRCSFLKSLQYILKNYTIESSIQDVAKVQMEMVAIMSRLLIAFTLNRTAQKEEYRRLGMAYVSKMNRIFMERIKYYQLTTSTEIV